ncbi:MAG TPA: TatD family hydrolase [Candidatus Saccharimonadales bacterium]|nr:TatD family hydrolase [Candidatus Saccharimonadales bacterium]
MIDVHCHVQFEAFENDYDAVIKDALSSGIDKIINVGTRLESSQKAAEFAEKYDDLFAIIGIHPHHADKHDLESDWAEQLEKLAKHPKVLAIGEIGLDYYSYKSNGIVDPTLQKKLFIEQIKLANKVGLPLQIHNRHAGEDIIEILKTHKHLLQKIPGMFHCFAGSKDILKHALELGFYIGFDGNITYKGVAPGETVSLSDLAIQTPIDRIVIETDSPYLTPIPFRGKRNEPKYAIITAGFVAKLKGVSFETFAEQTDKNVHDIFEKLK